MAEVPTVPTVPALPPPSGVSEEAALLVREARDYINPPSESEPSNGEKQNGSSEPRAEAKKKRIRNYSGDRLFKEEPQRYRLIADMVREGLSDRQIARATHSDTRTVKSVGRRESVSVPSVKQSLTGTLARVARMTAQRLEQEVPNMNHAQLAVTCGIATDKLLTMTGDANFRVEHTLTAPRENIFDRMARLHSELVRTVQGRVIETAMPILTEQ